MIGLLTTLAAFATEPVEWTISVDPLTFALGFAHVQIEHSLGSHASIYVGPSLKLFPGLLGTSAGDFRGYGGEIGGRAFFVGEAPEGGWVMLRAVVADVVGFPTVAGGRQSSLGGYSSVLLGYTAVTDAGLVLSGGAGLSFFDYGSAPGVEDYGLHGFLPALHTAIGWAF